MKTKSTYNEFYKKESEMFNQAADYYDRFRPSYPREIIHTLIEKSRISKGSKLLEIGSGSGKATVLLKDGEYNICCIDPGLDLVRKGNENFSAYPNVRFICSRFEEYKLEEQSYELIYAAQSFHWVPQPIGFEKCAYILKEKGYLAPFWNMYITYDNEVDRELLEISSRYGGFADFLSEEDCEKRISSITNSIEKSGLFTKPEVYRHLWKQTYTADEYYGFALNGNAFMQKSDSEKDKAYRELIDLADRHGGVIERPYLCVLYIARKL
jgi:ubiquinone/menaquinone biosynthesis C-methylase UbiE